MDSAATGTATDLHATMLRLGEAARAAARELGTAPSEVKVRTLREAAAAIRAA